jgi:WD40 repeat protein
MRRRIKFWIVVALSAATLIGGAQPIREFSGHSGALNSVAFSPDGKTLLTASADHSARLWDVGTGMAVGILSKHSDAVNSAVFSPSGKSILTGSSDGTVGIWTGSGDFRATVDFGLGVYSVAFSHDGTRFLVGTGTTLFVLPPRPSVYVFDAQQGGKPLLTIGQQGLDAFYTSLAYSSTEAKVLTGMAGVLFGEAKLWDATSGNELFELGVLDRVNSVAFSPDGTKALTASGNAAHLWDVATGKAIRDFPGHQDQVNSVAFSSDGARLLTGSSDKTAKLWDTSTGESLSTFSGHSDKVNCVAFSPDGTLVATASSDKTAKLWGIASAPTGPVLALAAVGGSATYQGANVFSFTFPTTANHEYVVQTTDTLPASIWTAVQTIIGDGSLKAFVANIHDKLVQIYRVLGFVTPPGPPSAPLAITDAVLPDGTVGIAYSSQLHATGGTPPYTWSLVSGSPHLPAGLSISPGALISGTPTEGGLFSLSLQVTDSADVSALKVFTLALEQCSSPVTAEQLQAYLVYHATFGHDDPVFQDLANLNALIDASLAAGWDPRFILGIAGAETTFGRDQPPAPFNFWGLKYGGNWVSFSSWNEAVQAVTQRLLEPVYASLPKETIDLIGSKYTQTDVEQWKSKVAGVMSCLGYPADLNDDVTCAAGALHPLIGQSKCIQ